VEAYIYVRDASGNFIENLAPPYGNQDRTRKIWGAVKEQIGGKDCGDGSFQVEELREDTSPERTVMFVADYSGSMILTIGDVEKGLVEAIDELRRTGPRVDRWGLTKFDHRVRVVLPPVERDRIDASAHLRGLDEYGGATALRDAMMEGIRHLAATEDKKSRVLVVFTDGQENSSLETSWQPILDTALKSHVQIHAIGYGQVDGDTLRVIADRTGGSAYVLPTGASLAGLFRGIIHKTKVYYRATYTPCQGTERRTLSVALSLPGENKARAAATYTYSQEPVVFAEDLESKILLLFPFESASLAEATYNEQRLAMAADFLKARRNYRMILTGFTDSRGTELWNRDLGLRRATAAAGWLGAHGVERAQLAVRSEGKNRLVHDPDYPDAWKAFENRRVEFKLVAR
jgi:outer membrane protein OmpA-like peptidoglycan-associated protein/Mg-chelatase subunit ChlD